MPTEKELAKSGYFGFHEPVDDQAAKYQGEYFGFDDAPEPEKAPKKAAKKAAKKKKAKK